MHTYINFYILLEIYLLPPLNTQCFGGVVICSLKSFGWLFGILPSTSVKSNSSANSVLNKIRPVRDGKILFKFSEMASTQRPLNSGVSPFSKPGLLPTNSVRTVPGQLMLKRKNY